ncbi:AEC family transporter [Asticcacaulis sp. EMRT-3]|uniref:AEC family transporter n=1 Tax=Asticcacaulis sp. EMRT-3 TaxID=3040349 RepID=UPI0024AF94CA|nr:AEC family transporter [Asticcacaulis sp. EMRT-3]MDI7775026.1 AEC family transporter [Asticcacaulis sp. EMRT-3]
MLETLGRVIIFFAFIGLGAVLSRAGRLDRAGLDGLTAYFYWLAFPCWLMVSFARLPAINATHAMALIAYACALLLTAAAVVVAVRLSGGHIEKGRDISIAAGFSGFINNSAFLGIPVVTSLFGARVSAIAPLVVAADFLILFTIGCASLAKASGHTFREALIRTAKNPTVIGALIGVLLMLSRLHLPEAVSGALDLLGRSGPPVALVALGGMLGLMPARQLIRPDRASTFAIIGKILLAPALVALVLHFLPVDPLTYKVCVFLAATPTAVSVFVQSRMYGLWYEGAARTVAQSTLISLFTLSGLALLLSA